MDYVVSFLHMLSKYGGSTRGLVKIILRTMTGKCELQRLCLPAKQTFAECQEVEYSLYSSNNSDIRKILVADKLKIKDAMQTMLRIKKIDPDEGGIFLVSMPRYLRKIITYNRVLTEVDGLRQTLYDETNEDHEELLKKLWTAIKGDDDELDARCTSRWGEIGFQGKNPATDFRGMGILGLLNLLFLFENQRQSSGFKIFGQSQHPNYGFSFAVMAINFTSVSFELLRNGRMKGYMYNLTEEEYTLENFQNFFVEIFGEFADYWVMRKPANIMAFNDIKQTFMADVNKRLCAGRW